MRQKKTVTETVYLDLRNRILDGVYLPNVHLVESDLIDEYNVSRATIREALRRLTDDGLVEVIPHKGVNVRKFSSKEIKEMYAVLECLECYAIRMLAESNNAKTIEVLEAILEENKTIVKNGDFKQHMKVVHKFHNVIIDSADNSFMKKISSQILMNSTVYYAASPLAIRMNDSLKNHIKMLEAIKNHDSDLAETLMKLHLRSGIQLISDNMDEARE